MQCFAKSRTNGFTLTRVISLNVSRVKSAQMISKAPVPIDCTFDQAIEFYVITTKTVEYIINGETYQKPESIFTLKPWLEYSEDEYGNLTIINRQLDLFETEES